MSAAHDFVTLTEYGDFECPYSASAVWVVKRLRRRFGRRLRFEFRFFPIIDLHPHAEIAAEAAAIADAHGRFWEMYNMLFENQDALEPESLVEYAEALGLNPERFRADLESRRYEDRVLRDVEEGDALGVESTPSFFIDGMAYEGHARYPELETAISAALGAKERAS